MKAALCDLGDPGWGIPGFRIELLLLPTPSQEAQCVLWRVCFVLFLYGPASTWHKRCHFACYEMILSYHLQLIFSLINWNCHVTALCFVLFWCGLCFLFVLVFFVFFCFCGVLPCFLDVRDSALDLYRSSTSLLLRLLQQRPLRELINQLIPTTTCS